MNIVRREPCCRCHGAEQVRRSWLAGCVAAAAAAAGKQPGAGEFSGEARARLQQVRQPVPQPAARSRRRSDHQRHLCADRPRGNSYLFYFILCLFWYDSWQTQLCHRAEIKWDGDRTEKKVNV